ncbi:YjcZ family sporulation protein [Neobacillus sp. K501]
MDNNTPFMAGSNALPHHTMSYGYAAPAYCYPVQKCDDFVIIIVLFILLIIIGAVCFCD